MDYFSSIDDSFDAASSLLMMNQKSEGRFTESPAEALLGKRSTINRSRDRAYSVSNKMSLHTWIARAVSAISVGADFLTHINKVRSAFPVGYTLALISLPLHLPSPAFSRCLFFRW